MNGKDYVMKSDIQLEAVTSMDDVGSSDHLIVLANASGDKARGSTNEIGGKTIHVASSDYPEKGTMSGLVGWSNTRTTVHEVGHAAGLEHFKGFGMGNIMKQGGSGTSFNSEQMGTMYKNRGSINRGSNSLSNPYTGQKSPNPSIINYNINIRGYERAHINNVGLRTRWTN